MYLLDCLYHENFKGLHVNNIVREKLSGMFACDGDDWRIFRIHYLMSVHNYELVDALQDESKVSLFAGVTDRYEHVLQYTWQYIEYAAGIDSTLTKHFDYERFAADLVTSGEVYDCEFYCVTNHKEF